MSENPAFSVDHIDHVELYARDVDAAVRWYGEVLGLKLIHDLPPPNPKMVGLGGTMLAIFKAKRDGPDNADDDSQPPIRWRRVAWRTDKAGFEQAQKHLSSKGVDFTGPVDHDFARSIYFNDPDGNPLEITYDV